MKLKKFFRPVALLLIAVMIINAMPLDAIAATSSSAKTSSESLAAYQSSYDDFLTELKLTVDEIGRTNRKLGGELESSEDIKERMKILKLLSGKVSVLAKDLKTADDITSTLSAIPQVRKPMKYLNKSVAKTGDKIKLLDKKIKPYYKKMTTVKQRVLIKGMAYRYKVIKLVRSLTKVFNQNTIDKAKQMDDYIQTAAQCADIEKDLSDVSAMLDAWTADMAAFRKGLEKINDASVDITPVLKDIKMAFKSFFTIKAQLNALNKFLRKIRKALRAIKRALQKSIKIRFKKKFDWIGMIKFSIKLNIGDIIKGPSVLFKLLERQLGEFLWKVAKAIGIKKIIKKFIEKAEEFFKKLLKKYSLDFNPELSGLKGLDKLMLKIEALFKKLEKLYQVPDIDLSFNPNFDKYFAYLPKFKKLILCKEIKEADLHASNLFIIDNPVQGVENTVKLDVANPQDQDVISVLGSVDGFNVSEYDYKATVTLETDAGYQYESDQIVFKAGETQTVELPWTPQDSGEVALIATVSAIDVVEKNVDNNSASQTSVVLAPTVDLAVTSVEFDDQLVQETPAGIDVRVTNTSDSNTAFAVVSLSIDDGTILESEEMPFDPMEEDTVSFEWTPAASGKYNVAASVMVINNKRDVNEENNTMTVTAEVRGLGADHVIENFITEEEVVVGKETELKVVVKNNGPKPSDDSTVLVIEGDDGFLNEQNIKIDVDESKEFSYKWTPEKPGAVQFEIKVVSQIEDENPGDEDVLETVDVLTPDLRILYEEELDKILSGVWDDFQMPQDVDGAIALIRDLIEKIKRDYSTGNLNSLMQEFSNQFPDYMRLINALQNDFQYFRNFNIDYRIDSIDLSEDEQTAFADVLWKVRLMLPSGKFYYKEQNIGMRFKLIGDNWQVDGMTDNKVFGASLLSMLDLKLNLSGINVTVAGTNIVVSGIRVLNNGSARSEGFRVAVRYRRSGGTSYTAYTTVPAIRAGSSTYVSITIPAVFFIPSAGDSLSVELDPDKTLLEINTTNNTGTENFPF